MMYAESPTFSLRNEVLSSISEHELAAKDNK